MGKNKFILILILTITLESIFGQEQSFSFDEIRNSSAITDYTELKFENKKGLKIAYYQFLPEKPTAKLIFLHGGGAYSKLGYFHLAHDLKEKHNIQTILIDLIGHGKSDGRRGDCSSPKSVYEDIYQLAQQLNGDSTPMYLGGHSSGGGMILNYKKWSKDTLFSGFLFVSPEFGYKSETERKGRTEFGRVKVWKFALNAMSFGLLFQHSYAVAFNYPEKLVKEEPLIVTKLTVNMANASTPKKPKQQMAAITEPIAIFVGQNDELFDPTKVVEYKEYQANKNPKSVSEIISNKNHLSILLDIGNKIGETITNWNK